MLPRLENLREVEIKGITNTEILEQILQRCLFIRKLKADVPFKATDEVPFKATDEFLFSLCKHCSERKTFVLCPQNGKCLKAGKYLESLQIIGFSGSGLGVACALEHLPVLKTLDTFEFSYNGDEPDIITGITTLQKALTDTGMPPLTLQLTALHFFSSFTLEELQMVFVSCPKVESVQIHFVFFDQEIFSILSCSNLKQMSFRYASNRILSSMELKQFLAEHGKQITVLKLMGSQEPLDLTYVNNILDYCCDLEDLCVWCINVYDRSYTHLTGSPTSRANLKKITLISDEIPQSARDYFSKLLCEAENIRKLSIGEPHVEKEFLHALKKHGFRVLEELCMLFCGIGGILMETLLCTCRDLKKIKLVEGPWSSFDDKYIKYLKRNNYALEISFISDFWNL